MKAHWLNLGEEILVTGTQDVEAARTFALAHLNDSGEPDEFLQDHPGRVVQGCIVPAPHYDEFSWMWREGDGGNRVKAVIFE